MEINKVYNEDCLEGKPMQMYKFKCDVCDGVFWKHERVQK